ncbi:MAG: NAD+ synthase, partial [Candidatus Altiarchaeota archaeon]
RYFIPGVESKVFEVAGKKVGLTICEDIWVKENPVTELVSKGAELIINCSASPFHVGKFDERVTLISRLAKENNVPIAYVNLVGGQDELVFDGASFVCDQRGELIACAKRFNEDFLVSGLSEDPIKIKTDEIADIYEALVLGLRDYVQKNGFEKVALGLSGGIDSAVTACIAEKAVGSDCVLGVSMPSEHTSAESIKDAKCIAENLKIEFKVISIEEIQRSFLKELAPHFKGTKPNVAEENLQARIRANILMALSNKHGYLCLATGNKSEMAVGYTTLYGDMAGGFAPLVDVSKKRVYQLANFINKIKGKEVIPPNIIKKAPSAELRPGQLDTDSLPPYEILDKVLYLIVEENKGAKEIKSQGFPDEIVDDTFARIRKNEFKRWQAPPGIKITWKAFGVGRRMPLTNRFSD